MTFLRHLLSTIRDWRQLPVGDGWPETGTEDPRLLPRLTWREIRLPVVDGVATLPNGRKVYGAPGVKAVVFMQLVDTETGLDTYWPGGRP